MPRLLRLLPVLLCVALPACGGDDEPARTAPPPEAKEPGPITIDSPRDDTRVRARAEGSRLTVRRWVSGTADPGAEVVLTGGCNVDGCVIETKADAEGRWKTEVRLDAPAAGAPVRVTAYYRGLVVGPEDSISLRLAGPKPERADRGGGGGGGRGDSPDSPAVPPDAIDPPQDIPSAGGGSGGGGATGRGPRTLTLIGDSLAVGIEDLLPGLLSGWRVSSDALTSRPLDTGMAILSRTEVPPGSVVAMSLFTNDDPSRTGALEAAVRTSVRRAGAGGCAIWATIARPPYEGRSYAAANALLRRLDAELGQRLAVVPWAETASRNGWLAGDRVHGTPEGYRARAQMYAEAARACG
jgi:hypothetical protein